MAIDVGTAIAYLDIDTTKYQSGISGALHQLKVFEDSSSTFSQKLTGLSTSLHSMGSSLTKNVTLPIAGLGTAATKVASDFEAAMSKVKAISGANEAQMDSLTDKAIEMGAKTKFSAKESADAFTYMAMAGWKTEEMLDGISGIMSLAAADGLDLATTSDIVTDALTAFGLQASDSSHFADVLAQASSSANTNVSMLGESFKYVAPVAGALGYNVEDISIALGLMANSGIKASQAGTTLRASLSRMVKPTEKAAGVMEEYGISLTKQDGSMKSYAEVMDNLRVSMGNLSKAEQAKAATILFGQEAMSGMLAIINASEKDYNSLADAIYNAEGRADSMAETMMDNLGGAVEQLMGALESLGIKIGTALTPSIRKVAEFVTQIVEKLNQLSDAQVEQIVQIAAIVAAIGPVLLVLSHLIGMISTISTAISTLSGMGAVFSGIASFLGPILAVVGAIVALVAIVKDLYNTNEEFRTKVQDIWAGIQETISGSIDNLKSSFETFKEAFGFIPELLSSTYESVKSSLGDSFIEIFSNVQYTIEQLLPIVEFLGKILGGVLLTAISAVSGVLNGLILALNPVLNILSELFGIVGDLGGLIVSVFQGDFESAAGYLESIWERIKEIFFSAIEAVKSFLGGFVEGFWETLKELFGAFGVDVAAFFSGLWESIVGFFVGIKDSIVEFFEGVKEGIVTFVTETLPEFIDSVIQWFKDLPYNIGYFLGQLVYKFIELKDSLIEWAKEAIPEFIENATEFFKELPQNIGEFLIEAYEKIVEWKDDITEKAVEAGSNFYEELKTWFKELPSKFVEWLLDVVEKVVQFKEDLKDAAKKLLEGFWDGLKEKWEDIKGWFDGIGEKIGEFFQGFKDGFSDAKNTAESLSTGISGSHKNGLDYVPYDGYVAKLHQGEKVLTKEESKSYENTSGGNTFNFYGTKKLDQRQTVQEFRNLLRQFEIVGG